MNINKKIAVIFVFIILVIIPAAYLLINNAGRKNSQDNGNLPPEAKKMAFPTKSTLPGKITLEYDKQLSDKSKMVFIAYGDSKNQPITTFDIDIRYNHNKLKKLSVDNLIPDFDMVPTDIQIESSYSELIITGIKSQYNNEKVAFNNTKLAKISFTPLDKINQNDIKLFFIIESTSDSNLVNGNNQDILGSVVDPNINL